MKDSKRKLKRKRPIDPKDVQAILDAAEADVIAKYAAGWTRKDFADALKRFFEIENERKTVDKLDDLTREVELMEKLEELANDTEEPVEVDSWDASTIIAMLNDPDYAKRVIAAYDKSCGA